MDVPIEPMDLGDCSATRPMLFIAAIAVVVGVLAAFAASSSNATSRAAVQRARRTA